MRFKTHKRVVNLVVGLPGFHAAVQPAITISIDETAWVIPIKVGAITYIRLTCDIENNVESIINKCHVSP